MLVGSKVGEIVDKYAEKMLRSGYSREQKILLNGIKNFEAKRKSRLRLFGRLRRTAAVSSTQRRRNKLTGKTSWFKGKRKPKEDVKKEKKGANSKKDVRKEQQREEVKTVLFCDITENGELASSLQELFNRMEGTLGFGIKVVERNGLTLRNQFPLGNLWEGVSCGREGCPSCNQGAEFVQNCTRSSILYESVCHSCNPEASMKAPLEKVRCDVPSLYVGESIRSLFELRVLSRLPC